MDTHKVMEIKQYKQKHLDKKDKKSKKSDGYTNAIMFICIGVILIIVAGYIYINGYEVVFGHLFRANIGDTQGSMAVQTGANYHFDTYNNYVIQSSRDGIKAIERNGENAWSVAMNLSHPFMQAAQRGIMVADRGRHEVHVITNHHRIEVIRTDNPIIASKINDSGYVAVVTEARGYQGKVTVYNPDREPIYAWHSVRNFIVDVQVSLDGTKMVVSVLDTGGGELSAGLMLFHLNEEVPYAAKEFENTIISNVHIHQNDTVIAVSDNQVVSMALADGTIKWQKSYKEMNLKRYTISKSNDVVIALQDKKSGGLFKTPNIILVFDDGGREKGNFKADGNVENLDIKDNVIVFNVKRDIYIITPRGDKIAKHTVTKDIKNMRLFENKRQIMLIYSNDMEIISIR